VAAHHQRARLAPETATLTPYSTASVLGLKYLKQTNDAGESDKSGAILDELLISDEPSAVPGSRKSSPLSLERPKADDLGSIPHLEI